MVSYTQAADKRGPGFAMQAIVCLLPPIGARVGIIARLVHGG